MSDAMNNENVMKRARWVHLLVLAIGLAGCAGDPALVTGQGAPLLGPQVLPLPIVAPSAIGMAPDCAGRLGNVQASNLRFEVASLTAGLVAVVDAAGSVVCVDSVTDVQSDLDATGQTAAADTLVAGFRAAVDAADGRDARFAGRNYGGDPEPQPNSRPRGGALPDPEPQPN